MRRLNGSELIKNHLSKISTDLEVDNNDPQYSSQNLNYIVLDLVKKSIEDLHRLNPDQKIVITEFGARAGFLGKYLNDNFKNIIYTGFEPYPQVGSLHNIFVETCEESINNKLSSDIISRTDIFIYADVLEHLSDPWRHLQHIYRLAKFGAKIIASIPNFYHHSSLSLISDGEFNYEEWGVLDFTHLRFFGINNILNLFELTGWRIHPSSITPAFDPVGLKLVQSYAKDGMNSWSNNQLTWHIRSYEDAVSLGAYQFAVTSEKPFK